MKTFKQLQTELLEAKYPTIARLTAGGLALKIRSLDKKVQREKDPVKQNRLISSQNKLIAYALALGIVVPSKSNA
jgi:hypothetical protein